MITRDAEKTLRKLLKGFPIVTVTGPRQSGKTTLDRRVFARKPYVSLEEPDVRQMALDDPRAFLGRFPDGAVLDEVQSAYSRRNLPLIPEEACHPFQAKTATDSRGRLPPWWPDRGRLLE